MRLSIYLLLISNLIFISCGTLISQNIQYAETSEIIFHGLTKKLSDIPDAGLNLRGLLKPKQHEDDSREANNIEIFPNKNNSALPDAALQKSMATAAEISVLSNWNGLKSKFLRSDNNLAVGPNHVVQMCNSNSYSSFIRVWNKTGDILIDKKYFYDLTGEFDFGDPNIIYDQQADRFVITFLYSPSAYKLIICVSETPDPTGAWYYYTFNTPGGYPDYEKLAVWGDAYIVTVAAGKPAIYALNRTDLLSGTVTSPVLVFKPYRIPNIGWQGCSPINQTGALNVPDGEPAIVARVIDDAWFSPEPAEDHLELFSLQLNWDDPEASAMSGPLNLPIESYNSDLCGFNSNSCLDQKGSTVKLWPLSNFITDKAQYRNFGDYQSIVCSHVCNADGENTAGIRWYELRKEADTDWYIYQESTYQPTPDNRWVSSIAINDQGSIAMGYNIASNTIYPGIRITGRTICDSLNTMAEEVIAKDGTSPNLTLNIGDYNGIATDPVDGTFWFTGQFNSSPHWSTNVVHFSISGCAEEKNNGISSIESNASFTIFPIPADNHLTIQYLLQKTEEFEISMYNIYGNVVLNTKAEFSNSMHNLEINTHDFPSGKYILKLHSHDINENYEIIINH